MFYPNRTMRGTFIADTEIKFGMHELEEKFGEKDFYSHMVGLVASFSEKDIRLINTFVMLGLNRTRTIESVTFDDLIQITQDMITVLLNNDRIKAESQV